MSLWAWGTLTYNCFYYLNEIGNVLLSAGNKDGENKGRAVNQLSGPGGEGTGGLLVVPRLLGSIQESVKQASQGQLTVPGHRVGEQLDLLGSVSKRKQKWGMEIEARA